MARIKILHHLESPWTTIPPIRLGNVPAGERTPERYVVVEEDGAFPLRIDVYAERGHDEAFAFEDAIIWRDWLAIGFGERVYLVRPRDHLTSTLELGAYFGHFYPVESCVLVASCERLCRLEPDGRLAWTSSVMGIDGVVVDRVSGDAIEGRGEWDPPGGWRRFFVDLQSGTSLPCADNQSRWAGL